MINESPHRGLNAAGAEADQSGQSQFALSAPSLQLIGRAFNEAEEASSPLVAALAYVRAGLRVFPCSPRDKSPLVAHGCKAASKDPTQIRTWWKRWPNAMIALATGPHNGILVLDVDMRGHGALLAACDTTVHIENAGAFRMAQVDKTNDGAEGEALAFTFASIELNRDPETGQTTTAPIVQPVDGAPPKAVAKAKLTKAEKIALRALDEAIIDQGGTPSASNHIPNGKRIVPIETWRQLAYRIGVSTSDEASAKRKAFQRASERLIADGRVGFYDGTVWLA